MGQWTGRHPKYILHIYMQTESSPKSFVYWNRALLIPANDNCFQHSGQADCRCLRGSGCGSQRSWSVSHFQIARSAVDSRTQTRVEGVFGSIENPPTLQPSGRFHKDSLISPTGRSKPTTGTLQQYCVRFWRACREHTARDGSEQFLDKGRAGGPPVPRRIPKGGRMPRNR